MFIVGICIVIIFPPHYHFAALLLWSTFSLFTYTWRGRPSRHVRPPRLSEQEWLKVQRTSTVRRFETCESSANDTYPPSKFFIAIIFHNVATTAIFSIYMYDRNKECLLFLDCYLYNIIRKCMFYVIWLLSTRGSIGKTAIFMVT